MELKREDGSTSKDGINNNTYRMLFSDFFDLPLNEQMLSSNRDIYNTLGFYTMFYERKLFISLLKYFMNNQLKRRFNVDLRKINYNEETKNYEYRFYDRVITFDMISKHISNPKVQEILKSRKRFKECHSGSLKLAANIKGSKVVTGYATIGNARVLHSIVEYESKFGPMILDYTMNIKMSKENYYSLVNFHEIASFLGELVLKDIDVMVYLDLGVKAGVLFHDEIMRDMMRNQEIFSTIPTSTYTTKIQEKIESTSEKEPKRRK